MPQQIKKDDLYVVIISSMKERRKLYELCVAKNIPIFYEEIFTSKDLNHLYGISSSGVGLIGTMVARHTPKDHIFHSTKELEPFIK